MDADVGGCVAEEDGTGAVAARHLANVEAEGARGLGADDAVRQGVARAVEVVGYGGGGEFEAACAAAEEAEFGGVRVVVPFPFCAEGGAGEFVDAGEGGDGLAGGYGARVGGAPGVVYLDDGRPAVAVEGEGCDDGDAAGGVGVEEGDVVPFSVFGVDDTALVGVAGVGKGAGDAVDEDAGFIGAKGALGFQDPFVVGGLGREDVVHAVDLVHARSLESEAVGVAVYLLVLHFGGAVFVELGNANGRVTIHDVHGVVVIDEDAVVVVAFINAARRSPVPARDLAVVGSGVLAGGCPDICLACRLNAAHPNELVARLAVPQRTRPDTLDIGPCSRVWHIIWRAEVQSWYTVSDGRPVHQIVRLEHLYKVNDMIQNLLELNAYGSSWTERKRRRRVIEYIPDSENVKIRIILVYNRVVKGGRTARQRTLV